MIFNFGNQNSNLGTDKFTSVAHGGWGANDVTTSSYADVCVVSNAEIGKKYIVLIPIYYVGAGGAQLSYSGAEVVSQLCNTSTDATTLTYKDCLVAEVVKATSSTFTVKIGPIKQGTSMRIMCGEDVVLIG